MKTKMLLLATLIGLGGCANKYEHNLTIVSPVGAPAMAFYSYSEDPNFETNSDASNIIPMMVQGQKDVVVLPTNAGISAITKKGVGYKIAATITFGNLFVAATGNDDDGVMDADDYIVVFNEGGFPDLMFHAVYGNALDTGIHYVGTNQFAAQCLTMGKDIVHDNVPVDYVLIADPAFTNVKSKKENVSEYANIQTLYKEKVGSEIFQASVFVKNGVDANAFLSSLEKDINDGIANPNIIASKMALKEKASEFYGVEPAVASAVTKNGNRMGLGFKRAKDNKEGIDKFLSNFGIDATSEEIYY